MADENAVLFMVRQSTRARSPKSTGIWGAEGRESELSMDGLGRTERHIPIGIDLSGSIEIY